MHLRRDLGAGFGVRDGVGARLQGGHDEELLEGRGERDGKVAHDQRGHRGLNEGTQRSLTPFCT